MKVEREYRRKTDENRGNEVEFTTLEK